MIDTSVVERISSSYWRNSQLSISRFSGGCILNGTRYILDPDTDDLVRSDIYNKEMKDEAKKKRVCAAEKKKWNAVKQSGLFDA